MGYKWNKRDACGIKVIFTDTDYVDGVFCNFIGLFRGLLF